VQRSSAHSSTGTGAWVDVKERRFACQTQVFRGPQGGPSSYQCRRDTGKEAGGFKMGRETKLNYDGSMAGASNWINERERRKASDRKLGGGKEGGTQIAFGLASPKKLSEGFPDESTG